MDRWRQGSCMAEEITRAKTANLRDTVLEKILIDRYSNGKDAG